jgi:replicative DNA helicase
VSVNHEESVLYAHLTNEDSLDVLAREGFLSEVNREVIPSELGRVITAWALNYYYENGRKLAPTKEAILATWGSEMEKLKIVINDDIETDSIEWAIEELRSKYATWVSQKFVADFAKEITQALSPDKVSVIRENAGKLHAITQVLTSHRQEARADVGLQDAYGRMKQRAAQRFVLSGLTFGIPMIDLHTMGVHEGELATFAAFSGVGKSWFAAKTAYAEWDRGRQTIFVTLENDLDMTFDRMACMRARIPYERWQQGVVDDGQEDRVLASIEKIKNSAHAPVIVMPARGERTVASMVRKALSMGAESIIIDQLSFVERMARSRARERRDVFAENVNEIKALISEGREKIPALVLHQIKREGAKEGRKTGRYVMDDLAESSEIERTSDFVFSVIQSNEDFALNQAIFQILKGRRVPRKAWRMDWRLDVGDIRAIEELAGV